MSWVDERRAEIELGLQAVRAEIERACGNVARDASGVTLVAVSKFKPSSDLRLAYELGVRDFGENYVQELLGKQADLALPGIRWHLIGHLQRNKARLLALQPPIVHTVDDLRLAQELDRRLELAQTRTQVLLQVNVAAEAQKTGCAPAQVPELLAGIARLPRLDVAGLMLIPPAADDPQDSRPWFAALAQLARAQLPAGAELSMGMSHDFSAAIAEGATLVRVGTAIFGARG